MFLGLKFKKIRIVQKIFEFFLFLRINSHNSIRNLSLNAQMPKFDLCNLNRDSVRKILFQGEKNSSHLINR